MHEYGLCGVRLLSINKFTFIKLINPNESRIVTVDMDYKKKSINPNIIILKASVYDEKNEFMARGIFSYAYNCKEKE